MWPQAKFLSLDLILFEPSWEQQLDLDDMNDINNNKVNYMKKKINL